MTKSKTRCRLYLDKIKRVQIYISCFFFQSGWHKMFLQRLRRMSFRRSSCIVLGVLCSAVVFTSMLHFGSGKFSSKFRTFMYFKESSKDGQPLKFPHLQPLRDMFANLTIMKPSKSDCMVASAEFSDLTELEKKIPVFLLIVVSTAPSRQDRREAIRQTWGTKCGGEVCVG